MDGGAAAGLPSLTTARNGSSASSQGCSTVTSGGVLGGQDGQHQRTQGLAQRDDPCDVGVLQRCDGDERLVVEPHPERFEVAQPLDGLGAVGVPLGGEQVQPHRAGDVPVLAEALVDLGHGTSVTP